MSYTKDKIYVLVEDEGLALFLSRVLPLTSIPEDVVEIISGRGWTKLFAKYELLIEKIQIEKIIPVIDADTISEKRPKGCERILDNPNLFRFSKDLEFAFDNWMLAEAIINMHCSPFQEDHTPSHFTKCELLVNSARVKSVKGDITFYDALNEECKNKYAELGNDRTAFVLPDKMDFALALSDIVISSKEYSIEIRNLIQHIEKVIIQIGFELTKIEREGFPDLSIKEIKQSGVAGKILLSVYPSLFILDLSELTFNKICTKGNGNSCWSPNKALIATEARINYPDRPGAILLITESGDEKGWISRKISTESDSNPCWFPDSQNILVRTSGATYKTSINSKNWKPLYKISTAFHCVSIHGRIARTVYDQASGTYFLNVGAKGATEPYEIVRDTTHVVGGVSWSPDGQFVAFANHINDERGDVCIYDCTKKLTRYVTSHNELPYFVCFSPDGSFILYTSQNRETRIESLRVVHIATGRIFKIFDHSPGIIIGCHSWMA